MRLVVKVVRGADREEPVPGASVIYGSTTDDPSGGGKYPGGGSQATDPNGETTIHVGDPEDDAEERIKIVIPS